MIYYGLQVLNPTIFLAACVIICAIISVATGSSWTTSATVGIALIGIADALGVPLGMTAGAVLSGAYFGDKISPMSDTTNLAPAMAGTDLFTHIRYMLTPPPFHHYYPTLFIILGFSIDTSGSAATPEILASVKSAINVSPWLFVVPIIVIVLIVKKRLRYRVVGRNFVGRSCSFDISTGHCCRDWWWDALNFTTGYKGIMNAITVSTSIPTDNEALQGLFTAGAWVRWWGLFGWYFALWYLVESWMVSAH